MTAQYAARLQAERTGKDGLIQYWREIGTGKSWEEAFEASFGISLRQFTADFPELRKNYKSAKRFMSGG